MNKLLFLILSFSSFYASIRAPVVEDSYFVLLKIVREISQSENRSESGPYDSLLVMQNVQRDSTGEISYVDYHLPTSVKIEHIKDNEPSTAKQVEISAPTDNNSFKLKFEKLEEGEQEIYLCPPEDPEDVKAVQDLTEYYWGSKYCLLPKTFLNDDQPKECKEEVKPLIVPKFLNVFNTRKCADSKDYLIFAYLYCFDHLTIDEILAKLGKNEISKNTDMDEPFLPGQPINEIYGLCIDMKELKIIFTHHQIMPSLLKQEKYLANPFNKFGESTNENDPIFYHEEIFPDMKYAFEHQPNNEFRMVAQMLVPTEDMPFPLWKKTTYTYFNIAPLWEPLVPLMNLINDRIRQLAIKHTRTLSVYSATFPFPIANKRYLNNNKDFLIPTIWNKVVYDVASTLATSIIMHNTPYKHFSISKQMCKEEEKVLCNFEDWLETSKLKDIITKEQIQFAMEYAYCCQVSETVGNYFGIAAIGGSIVDMNFQTELVHNEDGIDEITTHRITNNSEELKNMLSSEERKEFSTDLEKKDN